MAQRHDRNQRHQDNPSRSEDEDNIRHMNERTAEQTAQIGRSAAEAGEQAARAAADMFERNAETIQNTWRSGQEMAAALVGGSTEQLGRTLGFSGNEAQQAAEQSARNAETIINSTAAISKLMNGMSQDYPEFVRRQFEKSLVRVNDLWRCPDAAGVCAAQSALMRDTLDGALEMSRRLSDMSLKLADAAKRVNEDTGRRAA